MNSLVRTFAVSVGVLLQIFCTYSSAAQQASVSLGTTGLGLQYSIPVSEKLKVRGIVSALQVNNIALESVIDAEAQRDIDYEFSVTGYNVGAVIDYFPFAFPLRFSFGLVATRPQFEFDSESSQQSYSIGSSTYVSDDLSISGTADFNRMGPYLSIGWSSQTRASGGLYFTGEIGLIYVGSPRLALLATGTAVESSNPQGQTFNIQSNSEFLADLESERRSLEQDIERFSIWPVVTLGLGYRF